MAGFVTETIRTGGEAADAEVTVVVDEVAYRVRLEARRTAESY